MTNKILCQQQKETSKTFSSKDKTYIEFKKRLPFRTFSEEINAEIEQLDLKIEQRKIECWVEVKDSVWRSYLTKY